jgi:hypothetical protein
MVFFPNLIPPEADKCQGSKNNHRNIRNMPAVIFIALLDLGKKSSFVDRHKCLGFYLWPWQNSPWPQIALFIGGVTHNKTVPLVSATNGVIMS